MLAINEEKLVMISVMGSIHHPTKGINPYVLSAVDHKAHILPGVGGITYNVKVGDPCMGMAWDHVEPGVSLKNQNESENQALQILACIGNRATVVNGDAKGAVGTVTGKHGGINHVLCHFPAEDLEKMVIGDKIQIMAQGQGMTIADEPGVKAMNLDPRLWAEMGAELREGVLHVPVAARVPAYFMGSGLGANNAVAGDYDITTADPAELKRHGLDKLRFGDMVFLEDCDTSMGRCYRKGAGTVGIVVHSDCVLAGHGPGVTSLLTAWEGRLCGDIDSGANIANYLNLK